MIGIDQLLDVLKSSRSNGYNEWGVRVLPYDVNPMPHVGDDLPESYDWDFERDCSTYDTTGETLGGTSCVGFNAYYIGTPGIEDQDTAQELVRIIEKATSSYGKHKVIFIGGKDGSRYGDDDGEIIIPDAQCLAIISE